MALEALNYSAWQVPTTFLAPIVKHEWKQAIVPEQHRLAQTQTSISDKSFPSSSTALAFELLGLFIMGANSSKTPGGDEDNIQPIRRQIGKRSSVNFLSRLDSRGTNNQASDQTASLASRTPHPSDSTLFSTTPKSPSPVRVESTSGSESNRGSVYRHKATLSNETQQTVIGPTTKSSSGSVGETDRTDDSISDDDDESEAGENPSSDAENTSDVDEDRVETPLARSLPIPAPSPAPLLPFTSVLESESPSKYGFDEVWENAQQMTSQSAKRRTMSGPELFSVSYLFLTCFRHPNMTRLPENSRDHAAQKSHL